MKTIGAVGVATLLCGYAVQSGMINWLYFGTPSTSSGLTYDVNNNGKPTITEFTSVLPSGLPTMPSDMANRVATLLPEGRALATNSAVSIPSTDEQNIITFTQPSKVWVTFISEGAAYKNSLGWFKYTVGSKPTSTAQVSEGIFFPNASMPDGMNPGDADLDKFSSTRQNTVYLGQFSATDALGFVLASNGYQSNGRYLNNARVPGVNQWQNSGAIFYSLSSLNPDVSDTVYHGAHTVLLRDLGVADANNYQRFVMGFEDINHQWGGDHDFNDVVFAIHVVPVAAPNSTTSPTNNYTSSNFTQLPASTVDPDTDGDGVPDSIDEYPLDSSRAFNSYYPGVSTWGTLAFEDLWPSRGDYDLNDMVLHYRTKQILNAQRQVVAVHVDYEFLAHGGGYNSGFGVHLPGIAATLVQNSALSVGGQSVANFGPESGQSEAVFIITSNINNQLPSPGGNCIQVNSINGCAKVPTVPASLDLTLTTPQASSLFAPPYNPFITPRLERGREVHLPGKPPTAKADPTLFDTSDDRTVSSTAYTFMDNVRRPWALDIPADWTWPAEGVDVGRAYPQIINWATSGGTQNTDWYNHPSSDTTLLYQR